MGLRATREARKAPGRRRDEGEGPLLLCVDTSGPVLAVALQRGATLLATFSSRQPKSHARVLLPAIELVLRSHDVALADVEAFGLCVGPGSFTGLRVGMSTIKALALDSGRPVVTVTAPELPQRGASGHVDPAVLSAICMAHLLAGKTVEAAAVEPLYGAQPPIHTPTA